MLKQIAKKLVARLNISWETRVGNGQVCLVLMFQIFLWIPVVSSVLTGTLLIIYGVLWVIHGISPLFLENRSLSVTIGCRVIVASGCCIMGLGIAMMFLLMTEVDWVPRMAGIFYSLAFLAWLFVIIRVAPIITQWLLIGVMCCVIASGYTLFCNALVLINVIISDIPRVAADWEQAIGYIVSGSAVIAWTCFVMRKTATTNFKILMPTFMISGIIYIGFGVTLMTMLMSR